LPAPSIFRAQQQGRPFIKGRRHLLVQFIAQIETRHRPDVVLLIARVAHLQRRDGVDKFAGEGLGNAGRIKRFDAAHWPLF
jgi:hypothetical protein